MVKTKIPLAIKIIYTAFMAVLLPVYLSNYGPTNFLYFCDMALVLTLVGVWLESALLISMCAVGIIGVQAIWVLDFVSTLLGFSLTGMTAYMFEPGTAIFLRGLSLFHGWLPFLLIYLVIKTGYDRRGLFLWTGLAWVLIGICFFLMPPPNPDAGLTPVNINYVWGLKDAEAQTWMPPYAWLALMFIGLPFVFYWPVHFLLQKYAPSTRRGQV
ncbi:MAG: hypothetical protein K2P92_08180 [Bdellovibrionaceae bacterium]|nr:hypothetical protein [Pseudobdellovibrionaceae bacterium]